MDSPVTRSRARRGSGSDSSAAVSEVSTPFSGSSLSSSTTSLSSMESVGNKAGKPLRDTYGNVFEVPNFTFKEIRDAIPAHCFKRSAWRSFSYVARDIALISATFYAFQFHIIPALEGFEHAKLARGLAWSLYTVLQGFYGTGLWVLAHECGHQAFSESKALNDFVGWVLHSILLVPYFSWKLSHYKHHASTGNVEKDMAHVPKSRFAYMRKHEVSDVSEMAEETPLWTLFQFVVVQQLLGWFIYLFTNATGHNYHSRQKEGRGKGGKRNGFFGGVNHFDPSSPIYESKESHLIIYSDIGIALVIAAVWAASAKWGFGNVMIWYGIPYLWVNHWIVLITFLQHTDPSLPHYYPEVWNYARGAAATIDREFGFVGRHLMHGIIETHVLHHFIPQIPFYNADEATEAIKKVMGTHYRSDTKNGPFGFLYAFWRSARWCQWVEESEGAEGKDKDVVFYRNRNGLGVKPLAKVIPRINEIRNLVQLGLVNKADLDVDVEL